MMNFTEVTLSYPCVQNKIEVSHFTARKSTAIEWIILEAISKCQKLTDYESLSIGKFFEWIFTISDADSLVRPVLLSLHDMGAIIINGIDDETKLDTVEMSNLKLTEVGQEMQLKGLLPGVAAEDVISIYYDVISKSLKENASFYKEESTGIHVVDLDQSKDAEIPEGVIREWLFAIQNDKKKKFHWLTSTTKIKSITRLESKLYWKNVSRKVELLEGMRWKISGIEDESIDKISLEQSDFDILDKIDDLCHLNIENPDKELEKIVLLSDINSLIDEFIKNNNDIFFVHSKYYKDINFYQKNKNKLRIVFVYGSSKFEVESNNTYMVIYVPNTELQGNGVYFSSKQSIKAGVTTVIAGDVSREIAIAYIPIKKEFNTQEIVVDLVNSYYNQENIILFALYNHGLKDLFLHYIGQIISDEERIVDKAKVIEQFNEKSRSYYGRNIISSDDSEKLLINEFYIIEKCSNIENAIDLITEYAEINIFKQDESLLKKIISIVLGHIGEQDSLENIWEVWKSIKSIKKSLIDFAISSGLHKNLYSKKSIVAFIDRFTDENLFEIEEYTIVERIILNMRRISLQIEDMLPELDLYQIVSYEKYNELILSHKDIIENLYDKVRQWQDEEERFSNAIIDITEVLNLKNSFTNVRNNIDGLKNSLAIFFNDSFIKFNKVYIVDTCSLINEPNLISWFDDGKALLVIPMVVLDELDGLKNSEDEEIVYKARDAIRNISNYNAFDWLLSGEMSYPELLLNDLDKERNDNKILSIAIKYCAKEPILLTDDINLGNIATANKIKNINLHSFQLMKEHEKLSNLGHKKKSKKKKK